MSPESVSIEAFREIRRLTHEHQNGHQQQRNIALTVAPSVAAQLDFWYEHETQELEKSLHTTVNVNVDAGLHPERMKVAMMESNAVAPPLRVRVGDEVEAELLAVRLPNPTSALAVVDGRLVEVENSVGAVGQTVKIKIIDIDEAGTILAESRSSGALAETAEKKPRRRRRGGRHGAPVKDLSPAEQTEELLELAEEAAKGLGARPPLGISTGSEPDVEDAEARVRAAQLRTPHQPRPFIPLPPQPQRDQVVLGSETSVPPEALGISLQQGEGEEGGLRRRRRRRRRRGRGPGLDAAGIPQQSLEAQASPEAADDGEEEEVVISTVVPLAAASYSGPEENDGGQRRRRRRRRRGGSGRGQVLLTPESQAVPERHIFRAASDGRVEVTGQTAPPEPTRAIARVRYEPSAVAVTSPPPSLKLVQEEPKVPRPTRRRRGERPIEAVASIAAVPVVALPAPAPRIAEAVEEAPKRRRTTVRKAAVAEAVAEAKPKRTVAAKKATTTTKAVKAAAAKPAAKAAPKAKAATTTGTKKKAVAKKTATRKVSTRKKKS
jgi:hypothetical protein